jgi:hypothetical protein
MFRATRITELPLNYIAKRWMKNLRGICLRVVLRDRLGQCLVGLKREQHIDSLRDLGLVCLTGGLVR